LTSFGELSRLFSSVWLEKKRAPMGRRNDMEGVEEKMEDRSGRKKPGGVEGKISTKEFPLRKPIEGFPLKGSRGLIETRASLRSAACAPLSLRF
jgi:hypothetical protein